MASTRRSSACGPLLERVRTRNYKSIGGADVALGKLTVLVGRNGAGKSNFLDALRFVADGLQASLDHAIKARGGIGEVRRRSTGHPRNFAIELTLSLPERRRAHYGFEIEAQPKGAFGIKTERLEILDLGDSRLSTFHREKDKLVSSTVANMPPVPADRLYLVNAAGLPEFRPVYDALLAMGFYNLNPETMKELQSPDAGELLHRDGANIASVVARLAGEEPAVMERIRAYLAQIVPDITEVERIALGPRETLQLYQQVAGADHPWRFYASSMSDGTLRALGALVAATQLAGREDPVRLVGIEEPETALHPAAAGSLMDALREAAEHTQIILTSHSPDLLDQIDPEGDTLLVVVSRGGTTSIAPVDPASLEAIRKHLYTPGELLRMDQLQPDEADLERQEQIKLFGEREGE